MENESSDHSEMLELIKENKRLLKENNHLLSKIHLYSIMTFYVRIAWILVIVGLPFVLYFFVVEPYFEALGSSFEVFRAGLQEIPGWKQFYEAIQGGEAGGGE